MTKAYLFAIFLLAASFTGCIGDKELEELTPEEETTTEEETLEPIGEDNMTSLRKEIDNLKATIKSYEKPKVYFVKNDDNGHLLCDENWRGEKECYLLARTYDINGVIETFKWETSDPNGFPEAEDFCEHNYVFGGDQGEDCMTLMDYFLLNVCDISRADQTLTLTVFDNDGNSASASYDFVTSEDLCPPPVPIATFLTQQDSSGVYHVEVIKVSNENDLTGFSFYLKDTGGYTHVQGNGFGEIAMQYKDGKEHGIDTNYSGNDAQLTSRAGNVSDDDGSVYPVHFSDKDGDGKLSSGDKFMVYGQGSYANGPAEDGWRLDIQYDPTGDIVGSATLQ